MSSDNDSCDPRPTAFTRSLGMLFTGTSGALYSAKFIPATLKIDNLRALVNTVMARLPQARRNPYLIRPLHIITTHTKVSIG